MIELTLASGNKHKAEELEKLFTGIAIVPAPKKMEIEESGKTFQENAWLKAQGYFNLLKSPVLADDSGLLVDALPGELGVHTARFGGEGLSDRERFEYLLDKLSDVPEGNRQASFVCYLCLILSESETFFFEGRLSGMIAKRASGDKGFGYDPIFLPFLRPNELSEQTLAELPEWKEHNSHRAQAALRAQEFLTKRALLSGQTI